MDENLKTCLRCERRFEQIGNANICHHCTLIKIDSLILEKDQQILSHNITRTYDRLIRYSSSLMHSMDVSNDIIMDNIFKTILYLKCVSRKNIEGNLTHEQYDKLDDTFFNDLVFASVKYPLRIHELFILLKSITNHSSVLPTIPNQSLEASLSLSELESD